MKVEIKVPQVGESITEGVLVEWHVNDGDYVETEQALFELETDKITMTVQAEQAGRIAILVQPDTKVRIGQVVGTLDPDAKGGNGAGEVKQEKPAKASKAETVEATKPATTADALEGLAPAVRRLVEEHHLDPAAITGTGRGGRLTKEDVLRVVEGGSAKAIPVAKAVKDVQKPAPPAAPQKAETKPVAAPPPKPATPRDPSERQTRKPMSQIRKRIAQRLLAAKQETAMLTTFNEVDMTRLMELRTQYKDAFAKKYGIKLGIMSFFVKAVVDALKTVPAVNRQIDGDDLIENHYYDIGIAVSTERGLMVPVIRDADKLSFAEVELAIADFANRAREGRITLDELQGGVFTITNGGVFGSMLSTPILNSPQSAILGMHAIKKRPVVVERDGVDDLEIRQMMYLAVSYDHRVIDGAESVTFLKRIIECIENPERMMFEI
ncbi:MAG: 2-oxoglutarate dehydrogenase complex dihydrolipoyllysine-residue succinyltransferase [bacterium]